MTLFYTLMEVLAWQTVFLIPLPNNIILLPNPEKNWQIMYFSHTTETQYLSITSLAENCKVSEATITRFCRGLGLSGYNAFKLALARADRTTDLGDSSNSAEPVSSEDSISTICAKVHAANLLSLNESYALYDEEEMSKAISILSSSRSYILFRSGRKYDHGNGSMGSFFYSFS
ncbi:MAG: MurR/RpiR family transcriptional regulator [Blautia wexlerae]